MLNILLNLFFVIVCKLDVAGVALASTIAQCVSAGLILHALTKVSDCYALDFRKVRLDLNMTKRILMLGVPAGLQNAIFAIAYLFIQAGVNSFDSLMVKGNSAAANADAMVYDAMAAFYMACASFMSQNYGAGKLDRVKKSYFIALAYVCMGNPHFVTFVDDIDTIDIAHYGKILERDKAFPQRCNIEFAQVTDTDAIRTRVWERGSGITMACGTGACATAVAAALTKRTGRKSSIVMDGGTLEIEYSEADDHVYMTGPAAFSFEGEIEL